LLSLAKVYPIPDMIAKFEEATKTKEQVVAMKHFAMVQDKAYAKQWGGEEVEL
jgi:phage terminase large subunit-like protein